MCQPLLPIEGSHEVGGWGYWHPPFSSQQLWVEVAESVWVSDNPSRQTPPASLTPGSFPAICKVWSASYRRIWESWCFPRTGHPEMCVGDGNEELAALPQSFSFSILQNIGKGPGQESYCLHLAWTLNLCSKTACFNWKCSISLSPSPTHILFLDSNRVIPVNYLECGPKGLRNM